MWQFLLSNIINQLRMKKLVKSLDNTKAIAEELAEELSLGDVVTLSGNLGSGKTSFASFLISKIVGIRPEEVTSPTFPIVNIYEKSGKEVWHYDLYRIKDESELEALDIDYALDNAITLIEWPKLSLNCLPEQRISVSIEIEGDVRSIEIRKGKK